MTRRVMMLGLAVVLCRATMAVAQPQWTPEKWTEVETLNLCTTGPTEGVYCFAVWMVVVDGDVYVRLGNKAADRVKANTSGMVMPVEISGQRFERVRMTEAPDAVDRVNDAMADKYTSDIFIRFFSHPLTLRLKPEGSTTTSS